MNLILHIHLRIYCTANDTSLTWLLKDTLAPNFISALAASKFPQKAALFNALSPSYAQQFCTE